MERFDDFVNFMGHIGTLKKLERSGWVRRGIQDSESVADHTFRTAIMALVLADKFGVDQNKAVKMALVHELAESIVGDLTPSDQISPEKKHKLEVDAFKEISSNIDNGFELLELFQEYNEDRTLEAKFVKRLDRLEMMFQAHEYSVDQPSVDLQEFWSRIQEFDFGNLKEMFNDLETIHNNKDF